MLVALVKKTIKAPKANESVVVGEIPTRDDGVLEKDSGKVSESYEIEAVPHQTGAYLRGPVLKPLKLKITPQVTH